MHFPAVQQVFVKEDYNGCNMLKYTNIYLNLYFNRIGFYSLLPRQTNINYSYLEYL